MKGILYVCHGSRSKDGYREAVAFVEKAKRFMSVSIQEIGFLELAKPTIEEGFCRCVERGATEIAVVPLFLFAAGHVKQDIPERLNVLKSMFPFVVVSLGEPFGVHERLIALLIERVNEKRPLKAKRPAILLVGRGTSDVEAKEAFQEVVQLFRSHMSGHYVKSGFLAAAEPRFDQVLAETLEEEAVDAVLVVPYLLFNGVLINKMKRAICSLSAAKGVVLCESLGSHPAVYRVLVERIKKVLPDR
ncbi:sirohydrochlorin chelatase [Bacillus thermotolerans]|uniref:Sirohydrochlorin ferrochelatase n=1 Tax=Bacillus thermotolerans TaxID=1221996 RepID=A0A0F5I7K8_BACTR|nr:sirohydrochlorin chelatase [Bacillus thermotolerans]KKB41453.1 Sirohydrochlorin ferrochelatase [Bacillus thermotolerans]